MSILLKLSEWPLAVWNVPSRMCKMPWQCAILLDSFFIGLKIEPMSTQRVILHTARYSSLQETYDTIPGPNKITFLLQTIRDASAAEEVCTLTYLRQAMFSSFSASRRKRPQITSAFVPTVNVLSASSPRSTVHQTFQTCRPVRSKYSLWPFTSTLIISGS